MEPNGGVSLLDDPRALARAIEGRSEEPPYNPTPEAPPQGQPATPDYSSQIAALQAELGALRQVTQMPAPQDIAAASAQGTAAFFEQARQRKAWEDQQRQQMAPPQLPPDDVLMTDPNAMKWAMSATADHAARSVYQALAPQVQDARMQRELLAPLLQQALVTAENSASAIAEREGIDPQTFQGLLPNVRYMIDNMQNVDPVGKYRYRTNPEMLVQAAHMERRRLSGGVFINPAAPPTSIGSSYQASQSFNGRGPSLPGADAVERIFGKKFNATDREWLAQNTAREVNAAASLPPEIMNR
jgi:hypothetical protein